MRGCTAKQVFKLSNHLVKTKGMWLEVLRPVLKLRVITKERPGKGETRYYHISSFSKKHAAKIETIV